MLSNARQLDTQARRRAKSGAFTLLELVLVIALIILIAGFLFSALGRASQSARQTASQRSVEAVAAAVEQFRLEFGFLPPLVHDGAVLSAGDPSFQPYDDIEGMEIDGPVIMRDGGDFQVGYNFSTVVVWQVGRDFDFFRRRDGSAADEVDLPGGGYWNIDSAWDDRRYSRFALAYYLVGALPRSMDGVAGDGMARPLDNGWFEGVGYPVGTTRDRYLPSVDLSRNGLRLQAGYSRPIEATEHGAVMYMEDEELLAEDVTDLYPADALNFLSALVDDYGTAYRYYRWEHGRFDGTRVVNETTLDLNIPPILLDPEVLVELANEDADAAEYDLTGGDLELRGARFAIVGAGADRLFGTEPLQYILDRVNEPDPGTDDAAIARIRKIAMQDNVVAFGK